MKKSGGESVELNYEALGERINRIRKEKGITQSVLAERVVIEPSNTSHIERAASKVGLGTLVKIANALECTLSDLLCDSILCERVAFCLHQELPQRHQSGYPLICEVFFFAPCGWGCAGQSCAHRACQTGEPRRHKPVGNRLPR